MYVADSVCVLVFSPPALMCSGGLGAYKYADGKKIDGRRIVVDVERGRTVKSWKPRRLGELYRFQCLTVLYKFVGTMSRSLLILVSMSTCVHWVLATLY